ncbi:MAG: hypothetical protein EHM72_08265 [Calditrichaeota bacterium]|nr:MAG: hypothetical protein EHM72_08265 [Calditrichota bacterium]
MEVKLENLIERLKSEGVEGAQKQADEIIKTAQKQAEEILNKANKQAEDMILKSEVQARQYQENAELALRQAARDGELLFKNRLTALFDSVFKREVKTALQPDFLKQMILKLAEGWKAGSDIEVLANEADVQKLEALLFAGLKKEAASGISFRISNDITAGFQIGIKNENIYYDFSDEGISDLLKTFLNPRLNEILGRKNG